MIKAVIFDYDETLTKTMESRVVAYVDFARAEYSQKLTTEQVKKAFGLPYEQFIRTLYGDVEEVETIIRKYQKFSENYPAIAYEGAVDTVNKLFKKYLVGIVSGIRRKGVQRDLETLKIDQKYFFHLQCGDDTAILKPDPKVFDPLKLKLKLCQINPGEVVYIGDDLKDFQAASAAGFHFIGVAGHTSPPSVFTAAGAQYITDFADLEVKILQLT